MLQRRYVRSGLLAIAIPILTALIGTAAPILPQQKKITDEFLSLAQINALEVVVETPTGAHVKLQKMNISVTRIRKTVEEIVVDLGIEVLKKQPTGEHPPILRLVIFPRTSPDVKGAISIALHLSIEQEVQINRLGRTFVVPTYSLLENMLELEDAASRQIDRRIPSLIRRIIKRIDQANEKFQMN